MVYLNFLLNFRTAAFKSLVFCSINPRGSFFVRKILPRDNLSIYSAPNSSSRYSLNSDLYKLSPVKSPDFTASQTVSLESPVAFANLLTKLSAKFFSKEYIFFPCHDRNLSTSWSVQRSEE